MIWTVCQISVLRLWNNKQELLLAIVVPVLFFSIFALIFSRGMGQSMTQVRVSFIDDDQTPESLAVIRGACAHSEIKPVTGIGRTSSDWQIEKLSRSLISQRGVEVVVHIPPGFTTQDPEAPTLSIALFNEGGNPIGHRLVEASLAESIALQLSAANLASLQQPQAASAPTSRVTQASATRAIAEPKSGEQPEAPGAEPAVFKSINAFESNKHEPKIAMYAAGIAVMFLLFSAIGAGASLLEEQEAGTLGRLLSSRLSLTQLLLGKWLFIAGLGCLQLLTMFAWGQLVFHVDLLGHLPGFIAMTLATSSACASFALFLASLCRSRQQLNALSIVLVLTMSAVGGSMVPRYVMSESMKSLGKFTFNGWALDGFQKIFWYDLPLSAIRLELTVLLLIASLLGLLARLCARRWSIA